MENLSFEEVDYWQELVEVFECFKSHVCSTLHICWGTQAGLHIRYGVPKQQLSQKLSGGYEQDVLARHSPLLRGFDDSFRA